MTPSIAIVGSHGFIGSSLKVKAEALGIRIIEFTSRHSTWSNSDVASQIANVDIIYWCASRVNPASAESHPELVEQEFSDWQDFLNRLTSEYKNLPRMVFLSSGGCIYSGAAEKFSEEDPALGTNNYGRLKSRMEARFLEVYPKPVILRIANVYGPGQPHGKQQGVISEWIYQIRSGNAINVFGNLETFRDYIYIDDLVEALLQVQLIETTPLVLNIGSGQKTNLQEIISALNSSFNGNLQINYKSARITDRSGFVLDIAKAKNLLRWSPKIDLESGIQLTLKSQFHD